MNNSTSDCIFCKIAKKELPTKIVFENEDFLAFNDIKPASPVHLLVIPKKHYKNLMEASDKELLGKLFLTVQEVAKQADISNGFRTVINTGDNGGQTVYHLHVHVLGDLMLQQ